MSNAGKAFLAAAMALAGPNAIGKAMPKYTEEQLKKFEAQAKRRKREEERANENVRRIKEAREKAGLPPLKFGGDNANK